MIKKGDTIGVLALAGACDESKVNTAVQNIENLGYKVKLSDNIHDQNRYLAGSDEIKLRELQRFYLDDEVKLILNARGGYGAIRLIDRIDYEVINSNPKPFCGFSDITALLLMIYKKTGQITFHAPMLCSDFVEIDAFTMKSFFDVLEGKKIEVFGDEVYKSGSVQGILWGGNLSTVVSLCGQDFIPEQDFIFFAEDLNEPVYKIDKMFTQLLNIKDFRNRCKAILLGDFLNIDNQQWLEYLFSSFSLPTVGGLRITHSSVKQTLPIGKIAKLEGNKLVIE